MYNGGGDSPNETIEEQAARQAQFDLLNGSSGNTVNYKKMLEYLSNTIGFKVNYQSLLGVSFIHKSGMKGLI